MEFIEFQFKLILFLQFKKKRKEEAIVIGHWTLTTF